VVVVPGTGVRCDAASDAQSLMAGGRDGLPGMTLGLVSLAVLHPAPCPIGVVPQ